ncbi:hypothetical protein BDV96DRAFT_195872 [Lophiotrema nucula]|uniref:Uncharacterized protein n=1 Tax=Lophiotrema nucula TaxID=690887 RepID=A0A6A5YUZ0_9PLEO|nr:hypothetical protein BDV96DRAFT_195872 [Lophiotrema nucula]
MKVRPWLTASRLINTNVPFVSLVFARPQPRQVLPQHYGSTKPGAKLQLNCKFCGSCSLYEDIDSGLSIKWKKRLGPSQIALLLRGTSACSSNARWEVCCVSAGRPMRYSASDLLAVPSGAFPIRASSAGGFKTRRRLRCACQDFPATIRDTMTWSSKLLATHGIRPFYMYRTI